MRKQEIDPIKRQAERAEDQGLSPMSPPDGYSPPGNMDPIPREEMPPILREMTDEHIEFVKEIDKFEEAITAMMNEGITREIDTTIKGFFEAFDQSFIPHHKREERVLFPDLHRRLLEVGEHGPGEDPTTCCDMMEDEHVKALQLGAIVFNFFGLAIRLPDKDSRLVVLDAAIEQSKALIELLRLHIFREDNIVYPLAFKYVDKKNLDQMGLIAIEVEK